MLDHGLSVICRSPSASEVAPSHNPLGNLTRHYREKGETVVQYLEEEIPVEGEEIINRSEADETVEQEIAAYHRLHSDL